MGRALQARFEAIHRSKARGMSIAARARALGLHQHTIFHLQHPSRTKLWYSVAGYEARRRIFGEGQDWLRVVRASRGQMASRRGKHSVGPTRPAGIATGPVRELSRES